MTTRTATWHSMASTLPSLSSRLQLPLVILRLRMQKQYAMVRLPIPTVYVTQEFHLLGAPRRDMDNLTRAFSYRASAPSATNKRAHDKYLDQSRKKRTGTSGIEKRGKRKKPNKKANPREIRQETSGVQGSSVKKTKIKY